MLTDRLSINTGLGFGAKAHSDIVLKNLKEYQNKQFINNDGSLNKILCVDITTHLLWELGIRPSSKIQKFENIVIYPKEYFCPISVGTQSINVTANTYSIHHYTGSWTKATHNSFLGLMIKKYSKFIIDNVFGFGTYQKLKLFLIKRF